MAEENVIDALIGLIDSRLLDVNTAIPAKIVSYANGRASVKPDVSKRFADGDVVDFPIIQNVRVEWPSFNGGQCGVKGPVVKGDPCLLIFAQQAVDGSNDRRMFDLADCYALMVNNGAAGAGDSGNNADMTMWFGPAYIRLTESGQLNINAPGGTNITTPNLNNSGNLINQGYVDGNSGLSITGTHPTTGVGSKVDGDFEVVNGDVTADGVSLKTHVHDGVQPGGGNTGTPV